MNSKHLNFPQTTCLSISLFFSAFLVKKQPTFATPNCADICGCFTKVTYTENDDQFHVLESISHTKVRWNHDSVPFPWPWTINVGDAGQPFESNSVAHNFTLQEPNDGTNRLHVDYFQLDYKWHDCSFDSINFIFDLDQNSKFITTILISLYSNFDIWRYAADTYHFRTPKNTKRYFLKFGAAVIKNTACTISTITARAYHNRPSNCFPVSIE